MIVIIDFDIVFIQHDELTAVLADRHRCSRLNETMERIGSLMALFDGIDNEFWSGIDITSDEDIFFGSLIS